MLALLSSMAFESKLIRSGLKNARSREIAGKDVCYGRIQGTDALLVHTGIGKVNAAHAATCAIENFPVSMIINFGVGGAYPGSGLNIGDVAAASKEIYGDEGVLNPDGYKGMKEIGIPVVKNGRKKYFNEFPVIPPTLSGGRDLAALPKSVGKKIAMPVKIGTFITVSAATGSQKYAKELRKRFNALCENMEGAAIAHICALYKMPMHEVRGISNVVGVRDKRKWNLNLASENCQEAVMQIIGIKQAGQGR